MSSGRPPRFRSFVATIRRRVPRIVTINLVIALAVWWLGWPSLAWLVGGIAVATAIGALIIAADFWTSGLPWRSLEQRGLTRNRDWFFRSLRYHLIDETVSERTIPLGCATFIVISSRDLSRRRRVGSGLRP